VRVFARYLLDAGLAERGTDLVIGTRSGPKRVWCTCDDLISVEMGAVRLGGASQASVAGRGYPGLVVDVGNPHLACVTEDPLDELDLSIAPGYDPAVFPHGVNVEFLTPARDGITRMRVFERGVGETRSCGTGTVAAAATALRVTGATSGSLTVRVPGGEVRVELVERRSGEPPEAVLTGPAVLVAAGELRPEWWAALRD
jgi:diaminopimelate epimerase